MTSITVQQQTYRNRRYFFFSCWVAVPGRMLRFKIFIPYTLSIVSSPNSNNSSRQAYSSSLSELSRNPLSNCHATCRSSTATQLGHSSATMFKNSSSFSLPFTSRINSIFSVSNISPPDIMRTSSKAIPVATLKSPSGNLLRRVWSYSVRYFPTNSMQFCSQRVKTALCSAMKLFSKEIQQGLPWGSTGLDSRGAISSQIPVVIGEGQGARSFSVVCRSCFGETDRSEEEKWLQVERSRPLKENLSMGG